MLLNKIQSPANVRELSTEDLPTLATELREEILKTISTVGGHLSSNLGTVELTVALHYVFNTPDDRIIWDVGHQTYTHKMLTGRREKLSTIRQKDGLSGFPVRTESEYDAFGTAHASTSISAALGMAIANRQKDNKRRVVAVIGDGALSGGMAFEALNNAGAEEDLDMLVILNDNEMSISPAVGAIKNYLGRILVSRFYTNIQRGGRRMLSIAPSMQRFARRAHEHIKGMVLPGTLFEEFGFNYIGPIDGHDINGLVKSLQVLHDSPGLQFLHIVTTKGKGYAKAEADPVGYHGVGCFEPNDGLAPMKVEKGTPSHKPSFTEVFSDWLVATARDNPDIVGITPAMREGSGLVEFANTYPSRYFDVGIAEQHAVTFAAGLACENLQPIVAIYSTFLQRAYDQLIHDVCIQKLPVVFAIDRGGLVGADGSTHHGAFDLSYLRCIPNLIVMTPSNENEMWTMMNTAVAAKQPVAVRYPRGKGTGEAINKDSNTLPIGKGTVCRQGDTLAILAFGTFVQQALTVAQALNATVVDMRFVKPLDTTLIETMATSHRWLVTLEDNVIAGGAGSAVSEFLQTINHNAKLLTIGLPDSFVEHGSVEALQKTCALDSAGIQRKIQVFMNTDKNDNE